jgi:class 3 adenylate cyclase/tetratricopeptide (TPR) repeat protein
MCGTPFPSASLSAQDLPGAQRTNATADGERRQLTVLFADLVGATALSGQMDPESLRAVLRSYQEICVDCVTRYGGDVHQFLGDGVLAYFGYPAAHENDAERAVLAGLAIIAGVQTLDRTQRIEARVGIHSGLVVVGEMGAGESRETHAIGETPNIAARIQAEAAPNSVCISAATLRLIGERFSVRALGPRPLKGVARDMELFSVVAAARLGSAQRAFRHTTPLIGRDTELRHLLERWTLAQQGQGQAVLLSGEGGIGKSRLLGAFRERAAAQEKAWRNIFCSPFYQNSALHPMIDLIERTIEAEDVSAFPDRAAALRRVLHAADLADEMTFALIGSLVGLGAEHERALQNLAPDQRKRRTLDALIAWLHADATKTPLVLIAEDLHWIDASTRDFIGVLLERIVDLPVLLVLTFRPEFVPTWAMHGQTSMLALTRLVREQVISVAKGVTAGKALPDRIVDEIVLRTDGVPLFVEELTKAIIAAGLVVERDGALHLASKHAAEFEIPSTLRDSLTARLDRLGSAKSLAQLASILGREFEYRLLQVVCDLPEPELEEQLAALNRAEIIQQRGIPPRSHYIFKHALIQEAAYDTLLKSTRQQHHKRVAEAYVDRFPEVAQSRPELVAHHYSRALVPEAAVTFWQQAGELAVARSGYHEALGHLRAALEQIELVPDSEARAKTELGLRVKIGPALIALLGMGSAETGGNYARACQLADGRGNLPERFMAMWGDWLYKTTSGQLAAASQRSEDLVSLGQKLGDDEYLLQAHHSRWTNLFTLGNVAVARADTLQGIRLYDRDRFQHHKHLYGGHDPGVCAYGVGANAAWCTGHTAEALRFAEATASIGRDLDHPFSLTLAHMWRVYAFYCAREHGRTRVAGEELAATCQKHGFRQFLGTGLILSGASRTAQGDTEFGLKLVEEGLKEYRTSGQLSQYPVSLTISGEAHLRVGNNARALDLFSEAVERSEKSQLGWLRSEIQRLQAEALLQSGQIGIGDAILRVDAASRLAREQGALALEWRAVTVLGRLLTQNGRHAQARERLQAVCDPSLGEFDSEDLREARTLLADLG